MTHLNMQAWLPPALHNFNVMMRHDNTPAPHLAARAGMYGQQLMCDA
jgi:hypothetical protein